MKTVRRLFASLFAILVATTALAALPAQAASSPSFTSSWEAQAQVWGDTHFTVHSSPSVNILATHYNPGYPNPAHVTIRIQRQTCGTFGCSWRDQTDAWVGGSCTVYAGTTRSCNLNPPISNRLHRVVITKSEWNSVIHSGMVTVS